MDNEQKILDILNELVNISNELIALTETRDPNKLRDSLLDLSSYKARVNNLLPDVQFYYNYKLGKVTTDIFEKYSGAKGNSALMKSLKEFGMRNEQKCLDYCDRINSTVERISENYRSVLSSLKAELKI